MKNFAYSILGCLLLSLNAAFAQKTWSFDGQDPLLSCDGKSLLNLYTIKEIPEFVTGVEGKALRTDGYSTWMDTTTEAYVPSSDTYIAKDSSINDEIDKLRHSATAALSSPPLRSLGNSEK